MFCRVFECLNYHDFLLLVGLSGGSLTEKKKEKKRAGVKVSCLFNPDEKEVLVGSFHFEMRAVDVVGFLSTKVLKLDVHFVPVHTRHTTTCVCRCDQM